MYTLMIKTHNITGLKYLCKCSRANYMKYKGSGKYWKRHLKKHGSDISTEVIFQSSDLNEFKKICEEYSNEFNIIESNEWANLINETGTDGGFTHDNPYWLNDYRHSDETKSKIGEASKKMWEKRENRESHFKGKKHSNESKLKMSLASKGIPKSPEHIDSLKKAFVDRKTDISTERRQESSKRLSNMLKIVYKCSICDKLTNLGTVERYHSICKLNLDFRLIETTERSDDIIECICVFCKNKFYKKRKAKRTTCSNKCSSEVSWITRNNNEIKNDE